MDQIFLGVNNQPTRGAMIESIRKHWRSREGAESSTWKELEEKEDISFEEFQKIQSIKKNIKKIQESGCEEIFPGAFLRFSPESMQSALKTGVFTTELKNIFVSDSE